jgi:hypothetical protein
MMRVSAPGLLVLSLCACPPPPRAKIAKPCIPSCEKTSSCGQLDAQLVAARQPLLDCIGEQARRGNLEHAHRCYRSIRLLESARWWLKTLTGQDDVHKVYSPSDTFKREFLCRIEALSRARTPQKVEALYLEMIRSYP